MTSRENTQALFDSKPAERVGIVDSPWGSTLEKWVTQGYPTHKVTRNVKKTVVEDGKEIERKTEEEVDRPVPPYKHFGFDMVGCGGWYDMMALRGVREVEEETDEWRVVRNGMGAALKQWKDKEGTPEHIDFRMTSREVWERDYRPHVLDIDPTRVNVETTAAQLKKHRDENNWTHYGTLFIWEHMRRSMGDLCLYESMAVDPDWIRDFNRVYTDHLIGHYKILFEEAGVPDGVWLYEDLGFKERTFCSPQMYSELLFPYYKEVVDFIHSYGAKVVLHSCGYAMSILDQIVDAGFDGLNPMEVAAGNDIFKAAEDYGDKLVFVGGFDKRIFETHDKDLIRKEVTKYMTGMKERGARFMFGSDHSISTNTDYEDYMCAIEVYREHMMY
jgi:uroporphyrinogen decarboxylase